MDSPFPFIFLFPIFGLFLSLIPIVIAVWVLLKIQSMDTTLKEISRKLDRPE